MATAPVRGLLMLQVEGCGTDRVMSRLLGLRQVTAFRTTNGTRDLIVEIGTATLEAFDTALFAIRRTEGISWSETYLLLSTRRPVRRPG